MLTVAWQVLIALFATSMRGLLLLMVMAVAVASAVAAGATRLEAGAVVTEASTLDGAGYAAVRDLSADAPIHVAAPDGTVLGTVVE